MPAPVANMTGYSPPSRNDLQTSNCPLPESHRRVLTRSAARQAQASSQASPQETQADNTRGLLSGSIQVMDLVEQPSVRAASQLPCYIWTPKPEQNSAAASTSPVNLTPSRKRTRSIAHSDEDEKPRKQRRSTKSRIVIKEEASIKKEEASPEPFAHALHQEREQAGTCEKVKTEVKAKVETEVDAEVDGEVDAEVDGEVDAEIETEVETEVKVKMEAEVEAEVEAMEAEEAVEIVEAEVELDAAATDEPASARPGWLRTVGEGLYRRAVTSIGKGVTAADQEKADSDNTDKDTDASNHGSHHSNDEHEHRSSRSDKSDESKKRKAVRGRANSRIMHGLNANLILPAIETRTLRARKRRINYRV